MSPSLFFCLPYLAVALGHYFLSGSADIVHSLLILVMLVVGVVHAFSIVILSAAKFVKKQRVLYIDSLAVVFSVGGMFLSMHLGLALDEKKMEETKVIGSKILLDVEGFREKFHRCPIDFSEMQRLGYSLDKPVLKESEFYFFETVPMNCAVSFNYSLFKFCSISLNNRDWQCHD